MSFLAPWNWPGLLARVTDLEHVGEDDYDYIEVDDDNIEDDNQGGSEVDEEIEEEVGVLGLDPNAQLCEDNVDIDPIHQRLIRRLSAEARRANAEFEANYAPARDGQGKRSSIVQYDGSPKYRSPGTSPKVPSALRQVLAPLRPSITPQFGAPSAIRPRTPRGLRRRRSSAPTVDEDFDINAPLNLNSPFAASKSSLLGSPKGPLRASIPRSPRSARTLSPTVPRPRSPKVPSIRSPAYSPQSPLYISNGPAANSPRPAPKRVPPRSPLETPRPPDDSPNGPVEHSPRPTNTIKGNAPRSDYHSARSSPSTPIGPDKTFEEMFEARPPSPYPRTPRQTPRSCRVSKSSFKDYRVRKVDPLRYRNKLDQPHRLPDTPTKSHLPPSPRRKGPKKNTCETCGRAFRVTKKQGGKAGTRSGTNPAATATAVVAAAAAAAVDGPRRSGRVRPKMRKFGT